MHWAWGQHIPATSKFVLIALAFYAKKDWRTCLSVPDIAERTSLDSRTIFRALAQLKAFGLIKSSGDYKGFLPIYSLDPCHSVMGTPVTQSGGGDTQSGVHERSLPSPPPLETSSSSLFQTKTEDTPPLPPQGGNGSSLFPELAPIATKKPKRKSRIVPKQPSEEFRTFFDAYPRGEDMKRAWAAWWRSEETRPPLSEILEAIRRAKKTDGWRRGFIPLAATWINAERWDDDLKIR